MQSDQTLCDQVAALLLSHRSDSGLPANVQILAMHSAETRVRPTLIAATEQMKNVHAKMRTGTFLLRYLADGDDPDASPETSQARLQGAVDWITTDGRLTLKAAMQAQGFWLRKLTAGDGITGQDGDRGRSYDQRFTVWIQLAAAPI